jgi:hypothetical protein
VSTRFTIEFVGNPKVAADGNNDTGVIRSAGKHAFNDGGVQGEPLFLGVFDQLMQERSKMGDGVLAANRSLTPTVGSDMNNVNLAQYGFSEAKGDGKGWNFEATAVAAALDKGHKPGGEGHVSEASRVAADGILNLDGKYKVMQDIRKTA